MKYLLCILIFILTSLAFAWPSSPESNMVICDRTGEQTLPKIAATSDGGCYVCWEDHGSGNYDIYLQRVNADGVVLWQHNGLLVNGHPQETWITDYDMTVDESDHAIIVVNDIRNGADRDIYAYRVSPDGNPVWGPDGITISDNNDFEPDPRVAVTIDGNIVVAWQQAGATSMINLRKLTAAGADVWTPAVITMTAPFGLSIPRVVAAEDDAVILQYLIARGSGMYAPKHIKAVKFDVMGNAMWPDTGVMISSAGGIGPQMKPDLIADGAGGAYSFWYDSHESNQLHAYAQHVLTTGARVWETNGVKLSQSAAELQMSPSLAALPGTDLVAVFYEVTDLNQNLRGVGGQALNDQGQRMWGQNGLNYVPLGSQVRFFIRALPMPAGVAVVYLENTPGSIINSLVKAFRLNADGIPEWTESPRTLCSIVSEKGRLTATINRRDQVLATWMDKRADTNGDIYLQNINPDGSLGDLPGNHPPSSFSLIDPPDSLDWPAFWWNGGLPFWWGTSHDPDTGDMVRYNLCLSARDTNGVQYDTFFAGIADTTFAPMAGEFLWDFAFRFLRWSFPIQWHVQAISGTDTVRSREVRTLIVWIEIPTDEMPTTVGEFALESIYPNPFNAATNIQVSIPTTMDLRMRVYDLLGRHVSTLSEGRISAGVHTFYFYGEALPSGAYLLRIEASGNRSISKRIMLLK
jgi:hypothetical protein